MTIETGNAPPISQAPYRASPEGRKIIDQSMAELRADDIIEESDSPWASPAILVRQKGKDRFCIDYRKINEVTKAGQHPIPRIDDNLYIANFVLSRCPREARRLQPLAWPIPPTPSALLSSCGLIVLIVARAFMIVTKPMSLHRHFSPWCAYWDALRCTAAQAYCREPDNKRSHGKVSGKLELSIYGKVFCPQQLYFIVLRARSHVNFVKRYHPY
jgi:hypothetical protein